MVKPQNIIYGIGACLFAAIPFAANSQTQSSHAEKTWIIQSNKYTEQLISLDKKYSPEYGSAQGLPEYDTLIVVPTLANQQAERKEEEILNEKYKASLQTEKNLAVKQDLNILIAHLNLGFKTQDFENSSKIPFLNAANTIYSGLQVLLDDQTPEKRRAAAVIRLQKYTGMVPGYKPLTSILKERVLQQMKGASMIYPSKQEMEVTLSRNTSIIDGIAELFKKHKLTGWEKSYAVLKQQIKDYDQWTRDNVLVSARKDFRMTSQEYALQLEDYGLISRLTN